MRWLVTGAGGMLGHDMVEELRARGEQVTGLDRRALDVTSADAVDRALAAYHPDVVVNCAAYTAVDDAEKDEERALRINGDGPGLLAHTCTTYEARLIHVSTDYVFAGDARAPYAENHPTAPRSAYGRTKLAGERAVLDELPAASAIVRTAWLYGVHGRSFVRTMIELEASRDTVDVVNVQHAAMRQCAEIMQRLSCEHCCRVNKMNCGYRVALIRPSTIGGTAGSHRLNIGHLPEIDFTQKLID